MIRERAQGRGHEPVRETVGRLIDTYVIELVPPTVTIWPGKSWTVDVPRYPRFGSRYIMGDDGCSVRVGDRGCDGGAIS